MAIIMETIKTTKYLLLVWGFGTPGVKLSGIKLLLTHLPP